MAMFDVWQDLWRRVTSGHEALAVWSELSARYAEPHRAYHTLRHIERCLEHLSEVRELCVCPEAVEVALWFHDVVYDTHAKDNEENSAKRADYWLAHAGAGDGLRSSVRGLIVATNHNGVPSSNDQRVIVDIDLAILGSAPEEFEEYDKAIRQEYKWVDEQAYIAGRMSILEGFLNRPRIFLTEYFMQTHETQARINLKNWIVQHKNGRK